MRQIRRRTWWMSGVVLIVFVASLIVASTSDAVAQVRWNAQVTEQYESEAEGRRVSFAVRTPPEVAGRDRYPLVIALSGGFRITPSDQFPFFQANPTRTRSWGFRSLSTYDAMQVIAAMKRKYPIDADRVYLIGFSAGGSGAMHLASCYPDQFAAVLPLVAAGNHYPLANFRNLPVAFHHGDRDWTSSICNARIQAARMKALGCPVVLREYSGAGHSIPGSHAPLMQWLFDQKRDPAPKSIAHDCEVPSLGRSYWFRINELQDPHRRASAEATVAGDQVTLELQNVAAFSLQLGLLPSIKRIRIGEAELPVSSHFERRNGRWQGLDQRKEPTVRPYEAGAAANLYQGEPLIVVYPTAGERTNQLQAAARTLARYGGSTYAPLPGGFPVLADTDLTAEHFAKANLILVGTFAENRISQAMRSQLPIEVQRDELRAGGREALPLQNQVLSLLHPNPNQPHRLVYILAPYLTGEPFSRFLAAPQEFLAGPDGFDRVSQADLLVQNAEFQIARQMQFDKDWNWIDLPGTEKRIPPRFIERKHMASAFMEVMREDSNADVALWWGPADQGMWGADFNDLQRYNPQFYTEADFRTQRRRFETTLAQVTGTELKEIWNRWGINQELQSVPELALDEIVDEERYRIHIPMDLYIKLGQRKKNLSEPQAGPRISPSKVRDKVFGKEGP